MSDHQSSFDELDTCTKAFFARHWNADCGTEPEWLQPVSIPLHTFPSGEKSGCYAFFKDGVLLYVGVGIGHGQERYRGAGLGARFWHYFGWDKNIPEQKRLYNLKPNRFEKAGGTHLTVIPFEYEYAYLAAALEVYLIRELKPPLNSHQNRNYSPKHESNLPEIQTEYIDQM